MHLEHNNFRCVEYVLNVGIVSIFN
jgi:hypothetical protein